MRAHREELFRTNFNEITSDWKGQTAPVADVDDSHVHNAASDLKADILLTDNVKDFGDPDSLPYDLYTPDEFFCLVYENEPDAVREVMNTQLHYWRRRGAANKDGKQKKLADALVDAGCPEFAKNVHECLLFMSGLQETDLIGLQEPDL